MFDVKLPRMDPEMKEGTLVQWLKKEGERVEKGEPLFTVETEKVTFEVEAQESGLLRRILVPEGQTVPIGQVVGLISSADEEIPSELAAPMVEKPEVEVEAAVEVEKPQVEALHIRISPVAKRLAEEHQLDITKIKGTGPDGRIVREDVLRAIDERKRELEAKVVVEEKPKEVVEKVREARVIPVKGLRESIARRMTESYKGIPQLPIFMDVDVAEVLKFRSIAEKEGVKISVTAIIVKTVATALRQYPTFNATYEEGAIRMFDDINVGVAVAIHDGLIVPVIRSADKKNLTEISRQIDDLAERARQEKLTPSDVLAGTFTVTNLGPFGVDVFTPIINPPQAAILGVGRIVEKPVVEDGQIKAKPIVTLSLVFDHRIADGALAAQLLQKVKHTLENLSMLIL